MDYPHSIPVCPTNGEIVPACALSWLVHASVGTKVNDVVVEQHHFPSSEWVGVMYKRHVIFVLVGHPFILEFEKDGRFQRVQRPTGAITFFPSHHPFSSRLKAERGLFVNVLVLALNPGFVSRVAEGLGLDADRIELTEQRGITDATFRHIAMALRAGVQSGAALARIYGQPLSTPLTLHLLR